MACDCEIYECLKVVQQYENCLSVITLDLVATETTTYSWEFEFNDRWKGGTVDVVEGEKIVLPWVFNEQYIHLIKFYNDGELLNDTCYKLDTSKIAGSYQSGGSSSNNINVTLTSEMLSINDDGQQVVTIPAIAGRTIFLIADGNQIYNAGSFDQAPGENSWTYTNGAVNAVGQLISIIFV